MARSYRVSADGPPMTFVSVCAAARITFPHSLNGFRHDNGLPLKRDRECCAGVSRPRTQSWSPYYLTGKARHRHPLRKAMRDSTGFGRRFRPNSLNKRKFSPIF